MEHGQGSEAPRVRRCESEFQIVDRSSGSYSSGYYDIVLYQGRAREKSLTLDEVDQD